MHGKVVSEKVKRHKVDSVKRLLEEVKGMTVEKACKRMQIPKRTYYQYKKEIDNSDLELKDQRVKKMTDFQKATLWLAMMMEPRLSIKDFTKGIDSFQLFYEFSQGLHLNKDKEPEPIQDITEHRVYEYLLSVKHITNKIERATTPETRETIIWDEFGGLIGSYFKDPKENWGVVRSALLPAKKR